VPVAIIRSLSVVIVTVAIVIVQVPVRYNRAEKNNKKRIVVINPQPKEGTVMLHVNSIIASAKNKK
jgi:hypothetical protein